MLHHVDAVSGWEGGEPSNTSDEHTELKWFSVDAMRALTNIVDPEYPRLAQQALSGDGLRNDRRLQFRAETSGVRVQCAGVDLRESARITS
jgi:hypothetical protein